MMSTLGSTYYNLADYYRSLGPDGSITADLIEILMQLTPVVADAVTIEANKGTSHLHSVRDTLPAVTWGRLYKGIPQSKSGRSQVEDRTGFVEGLSTIDKRLLDIAGPKANAVRLSEAKGFIEALCQAMEQTVFYGDEITTPEKFKGLAARYNSLSNPNVVDGGGSGADNTSIYMVTWSEDLTAMLTPQGIPAGLHREDKGEQRITDASGAYYVLEELFRWYGGLVVKDPRYNVRIANIDVSNALAGSVDLYDLLRKAYYRLQARRQVKYQKPDGSANPGAASVGRTVIYMNRSMFEVMDALSTNNGNSDNFVRLTPMELEGKEVMSWRGLPIRETDSLLNTETVVS